MQDMIEIFKLKWNSDKKDFITTVIGLIVFGIITYYSLNIIY